MSEIQTRSESDSTCDVVSTRLLAYSPAQVFRAFSQPERLARWWGPAGFRNTFHTFDFRVGGDWRFVMHGPDGTDYSNHNVFEQIEPTRIVLRHCEDPHFVLTITLKETVDGSWLNWVMRFPTVELRDRVAGYCVPANEQVFDRLEAELASHS